MWSASDADEDEMESKKPAIPQPIHYFFLFLLLWQAAFKVSNAAVASLLCFFKYFVQLIGKAFSQWILDSTCRRTEGVLGWNGTSNSFT